ncbi:hypothetical protein PVAND_008407 [Polypedilum vanderplanki]|uniref:Uncharacterized protein n=1 Tax=Polypedilum vanderplanki TaxID=319348 RepID=A0A9J6CAI1_POLVA|nr:hypothetical protein PVAND_008407 [Polypedilum vanderplanki]
MIATGSVKLSEADIPETWDTIKRKNPIHPTYSRGKIGTYSFSNNKYHCYRVIHSSPTYNLMPYRPTGFGFAERNRKYIPLTHVHDRSGGKKENILSRKSQMMTIYENTINEIKERQELNREHKVKKEREEGEIRKIENNYRKFISKLKYEAGNLSNDTDEMIGDVIYRTHRINRLVRDYKDLLK